jgi:dihydroorotase-like cyclic amidohydrolase
MPRTLFKNGTVISPTGVSDQDVLIDGETIAAVGARGFSADAEDGNAHGAPARRHLRQRPARMFGIHPKKGITAPGADGDVLVRDPTTPTRIGINDKHHMNLDCSAYEGFVIDGKVDTVKSRGTVVIEDDAFKGKKGHGRFIERGLSQYLV